jgi:hypothetical protein
MADGRQKAVSAQVFKRYATTNWVHKMVTQEDFTGDAIDLINLSGFESMSDSSVRSPPSASNINNEQLTVDRSPAVRSLLRKRDSIQVLNGSYGEAMGQELSDELNGGLDRSLLSDMALVKAWTTGTASSYHVNVAGAALTNTHIETAIALISESKRVRRDQMMWVCSSFGHGSVANSGLSYIAKPGPNGQLGVGVVGELSGIPLVVSDELPARRRTIASTAWQRATNELTITVAAGHGVVAGQMVTFDTATAAADVSTAVAVIRTTATTIVIPQTAADAGPTTEAGTITTQSAVNLLIAKNASHVSIQALPDTVIKQDFESTSEAVYVDTVWGFYNRNPIARAGDGLVCPLFVVLHTPGATI